MGVSVKSCTNQGLTKGFNITNRFLLGFIFSAELFLVSPMAVADQTPSELSPDWDPLQVFHDELRQSFDSYSMMKVVNSSCFPSRLHYLAPSFRPATESKSPLVGVIWTLRGLRRRSTKLSDRAFFCSDAGDGSNRCSKLRARLWRPARFLHRTGRPKCR